MIWDFEHVLSRRLLTWTGVSVLAGLVLFWLPDLFWRGFGLQTFLWGVVDGWIAWWGLRRVLPLLGRRSTLEAQEKEAKKMQRILWVNTGLDVVYMAVGIAVVTLWRSNNAFTSGTGWGIVVQGAFLFIFDTWHATRVPGPFKLPDLPFFTHPDHQPYLFEGGKPAALLVHGFPGTAFEMRDLGKALNQAGWTVRGVVLPGFGSDLATVMEYRNEEWVAAVREEVRVLRDAGYAPILLVGYSFGAALTSQAAAEGMANGLVLLAPFTWREARWLGPLIEQGRALLPLTIAFFRRFKLTNPVVREVFDFFLPEIDLEDAQQKARVQTLRMPTYVFLQLREVGIAAYKKLAQIYLPTLVIQGESDKTIPPERTQQFLDRFGVEPELVLLPISHSLTMAFQLNFPLVAEALVGFTNKIIGG